MNSFQQPENSLYKSVAHHITARAEISQRPGTFHIPLFHSDNSLTRTISSTDHTLPASILAKGIVKKALRSSTPIYYSAGGKATLFWFLAYLPKRFVWFMLAIILGTRDVGKAVVKK